MSPSSTPPDGIASADSILCECNIHGQQQQQQQQQQFTEEIRMPRDGTRRPSSWWRSGIKALYTLRVLRGHAQSKHQQRASRTMRVPSTIVGIMVATEPHE